MKRYLKRQKSIVRINLNVQGSGSVETRSPSELAAAIAAAIRQAEADGY